MGAPAPVGSCGQPPLLHRPLAMKAESVGFLLLSLADLLISRVYFAWENPWWGYEVNPVAAYVLRHYGVRGLALYKLGITALVLVACQAIWEKYPRLARAILVGGCLIYACVVFHSVWRLYEHTGITPGPRYMHMATGFAPASSWKGEAPGGDSCFAGQHQWMALTSSLPSSRQASAAAPVGAPFERTPLPTWCRPTAFVSCWTLSMPAPPPP